ncbi:aldo/keto reductase [Citreimonas salinaria]|uniref:Predicted oxidoreductase n=1 Tax=Citreimonas salinaria TaxID=321339 RepID=A0A1H3J8I6_9RHOB|nr:aldo/keto reductase [Citreimonas salinaria]SDY36271.1 Predicted oxidoreductase [Citreimonas salinaria]
MKTNQLGRTDITVTEYCLGTMTFGSQTDEATAHAQIDRARDAGINFMDAAEMYPVNPVKKETIGLTEQILGNWFAKTGRRNEWIVATKHSGEGLAAVRDGAPITSDTIPGAVESSLKRLQADHIDLYQFHWPNRGSFMFRKNWRYDPTASSYSRADVIQDIEDCLGALTREVERGTIRAFGLSNDSAWGTMQWLREADRVGGPRVATIQNEYSLLCRMADTDLAELMHYEDVGLLPFSPLAAGLLSGKYQDGAVPEGSRMAINGDLGGRKTERAFAAVDAYLALAREFDIDPVHMALAFTVQRPFVASSIFGATTLEQLDRALGAIDLRLSEELLERIDAVHKQHPMPY